MRTFTLIIMLSFSNFLYAADGNSHIITVDTANPKFTITVPANPRTGFSWSVKQIDSAVIEKEKKQYRASNTKLLGVSGEMVFTFQLKELKSYPASSRIILFYSHPKMRKKGKIKIYTVKIISTGLKK